MKIIKDIFQSFRAPEKTRTVLVIDDCEIDRRVATSILGKHYHILLATGGQDGIILAREKKPDLIILDFMMPLMQGPEVCRILREDEQTRGIPIIFLTSMDTPATVIDSFVEGADFFLTKPISRLELIKQVRTTLETSSNKGALC